MKDKIALIDVSQTTNLNVVEYCENTMSDMKENEIRIICCVNDKIIGHAIGYDNYFHPYSKGLTIDIKSGSALIYEEIVAYMINRIGGKIRVGFDHNNSNLIHVLEKYEFKKVTTSHLPEMLPSRNSSTSFPVVFIKDAPEELLKQFKRCHYDTYKRDHNYNPLNTAITLEEFVDVTMSDISEDYSFLVEEGGDVIIGCLVYIDNTEAEVGYFYSTKESMSQEHIEVCLDTLNQMPVEKISFEIDDVNRAGMQLIHELEANDYELWDVYMR